ncbi:TonB-dependent receptor domain-containing protein [Oceanimonas baumannii]|uniref:TonB-dependent receptor domain-containing protein n=1 Tax=Oceanimonas baumannii TaxID=129578 RepID=UPI003A92F1AF
MRTPFKPRLLSVWLAATLGLASSLAPEHVRAAEAQSFDIAPGRLDTVLSQFALDAGITFHLNGSLSQGVYSEGIHGSYSPGQALTLLLNNTGLRAERQPDGAYRIVPLAVVASAGDVMALDVIDVRDSSTIISRDEEGKFAVYDDDVSTTYAGKETIERFKGKSDGDVLKGMVNVYSGDPRNGGGLDPNIRGIQGPGRVPVTIDGTEQALTVYRGYRGVSNRSYIDPNLIGGIKVYKGPVNEANTKTSVGGGVVVSTIEAEDILRDGQDMGGELVMEGSNNATKPKWPSLYTGQDYRDVPGFPDPRFYPYADPSVLATMDDSKNSNPFSGDDYSYRLALAKRTDNFELLGAYAYRYSGNYFSGKNSADFYSQHNRKEFLNTKVDPTSLAHRQLPGHEVPNTSNEMESVLLKGKLKLADNQEINAGVRHTQSHYGDIMASRSGDLTDGKLAQWPESNLKVTAYNLGYQWNPENRLINLEANLWHSGSETQNNDKGGFPNWANQYPSWNPNHSPVIRNTAVTHSRDQRVGFDISNEFDLTDHLSFKLGGKYEYHKLRSDDEYSSVASNGWQIMPRAGRRQEYDITHNFNWQPTSFLEFNVGGRYGSYWVVDDFKQSRIDAGDEYFMTKRVENGHKVYYEAKVGAPGIDGGTVLDDYLKFEADEMRELGTSEKNIERWISFRRKYLSMLPDKSIKFEGIWEHDGNGKYDLDNNVCFNKKFATSADSVEKCSTSLIHSITTQDNTKVRNEDSGWTPTLSATLKFNDSTRLYGRYTEQLRFPSMFESTLGFSASSNRYGPLEPEHAKNFEVALVHNFNDGDIKLSYYHHKTENLIDRNTNLEFSNIDSQTLEGIELQARYDIGHFYADLGAAYLLKNKVCDEQEAIIESALLEYGSAPIAACQHAGFGGANYTADYSVPPYSLNLDIGARWLNEKLTTGTRVIHLAGNDDDDYIERDDTTTFDAYVQYQHNKNLGFEVVGTNITDAYYTDPLARSSVPAPGRTVKLKMNFKF